MDLQMKDKIALVTGSSSGLGFAIARLLSQEGAKVAINGRNPDRLKSAAEKIADGKDDKVIAIQGDVTDAGFPEKIINKVIQTWGGLDLLVTNAGGPPPGTFESLDDKTWQDAFELSFLCFVRLIRAALPDLKKSSSPSVLTITSMTFKQPLPNMIISNSLRAASSALTKSLALELGEEGIRFNAILPSWTETERVYSLLEDRARRNETTFDEEMKKQSAESVFGRMGKPEEFANAAVFLLSPAASYITGVMLSVDGGAYKGIL